MLGSFVKDKGVPIVVLLFFAVYGINGMIGQLVLPLHL